MLWAIERYDTERGIWVLQWNGSKGHPYPHLFRTRAEARRYLADAHAETMRVHREVYPVDLAWLKKHWRQRPVKVEIVKQNG